MDGKVQEYIGRDGLKKEYKTSLLEFHLTMEAKHQVINYVDDAKREP